MIAAQFKEVLINEMSELGGERVQSKNLNK
jgi:hypothetical protein